MDSKSALLHGSDAFLRNENSVDSEKFFDRLTAIDAVLDNGRRNETEYKRVRIAILDSGIDMTHSEVQSLKQGNWPRVTYCDFTGENLKKSDEAIQDSIEDGVDLVGHGTHIAVTVMRIAKWAEIYVARVVDSEGKLSPQSIGRALNRSVETWKVDIISMSFGFSEVHRECFQELQAALNSGILVFAAASNQGASGVTAKQTWPAREALVFGAYSADIFGNSSRFNPPEVIGDGFSHFKFLGENVESAWPLDLLHSENQGIGKRSPSFRKMTGTSVAAPIGAATAALFIEFVQQSKGDDDELEILIKSPSGMRDVFTHVEVSLSPTHILRYVLPWHLIKAEGTLIQRGDDPDEKLIAKIAKRALADVDSALGIQRLSGEEQKQKRLQLLTTGAQGVKRKSEIHEESFKTAKKVLRDSTKQTLRNGVLGSAGIISLVAGATFLMGPLALVFGSYGLKKFYQYIWGLLEFQRSEVGNVLATAAKEEADLLHEFEEIVGAVSEDSAVTVPARMFIKSASRAVARAKVLRQSNLAFLRESVGVDTNRTENVLPSTQKIEMGGPALGNDILMLLSAPAPSRTDLDIALRTATGEIKVSNEHLVADADSLNQWIQNFGSWSTSRPELPPLTDRSSRFGNIIRNDVVNIKWYKEWEHIEHSIIYAARARFLTQLHSTSRAFTTEIDNHTYLGNLLVNAQQNIKELATLVETDLPRLKQKVRNIESQRDLNLRTQFEGEESWVRWFLKWLELANYLSGLFGTEQRRIP